MPYLYSLYKSRGRGSDTHSHPQSILASVIYMSLSIWPTFVKFQNTFKISDYLKNNYNYHIFIENLQLFYFYVFIYLLVPLSVA